ncbi:hypothetical protein [Rhizobium laguerreae]|uniref:hypothetical protein n=1 Tax=Rhizobium laguerreae TaxID=1076926 RepID=UPI00144256BF|nr:hypothetical protein [Rhizobium laguerreae]NKM72286.1 hypothetical protein [Rhizobium laguerreae]
MTGLLFHRATECVSRVPAFRRSGVPNLRSTGFETTHILVRAPFAVFLLPIRGWKRVRANGEGLFFSTIKCLLGGALGFMVTLATLLLVAIPIQVAFESR